MEVQEITLSGNVMKELIRLSADWEAEGCSWGYRTNADSDLRGKRHFVAEEGGEIIGYLFGELKTFEEESDFMPKGTDYFEVQEIYVKPARRSQGVGSALFRYMESRVKPEAKYLMLGTATKDFRAILHFYIDELGMEFWSAALFKKL